MKKNFFLTLMLALVALFSIETATAQAPVDSPEQAITGLLNRIGGNGAANKFEIVIDASLAQDGKDVFVITSQNGKPCIKGNTQLSVATGINWYLNHHAHINLTWNNLTTDLSQVTLPVPTQEEKHVSSAKYRYDFNTCTFSYSMAFWTWERWQQEIDWMALHGINAPLNLVGLEVVTRNFLKEIGVSESDIDAYIAGPGFMAWFAMNNLEGWGSTINSSSTGVEMDGNPDWWYTRQEQLCRNMMQRMRELGMQPVIPGFSGQVPKCLTGYTTIDGFSGGDVVTVGSWASNFPHPGVVNPSTNSYKNLADVYYKHLHDVMGISEFYSIDPFHEMSAPVAANVLYPNIMSHLDRCYALETAEERAKFNAPELPKWIIQYWQGTPVTGAFSAMKNAGYTNRFIALDLFADNIYADNAAKWRTNYYDTCPYIYCMLHNFGGRSGMHGRLQTTMDGYFEALAKNNNCQGIGATPEGTETNPVLYDMLFELPWMDVNNRPTADEWLKDYAYSRYGVKNDIALEALKNLKKSVWDCKVNQQGTSEAVILARPNWTVNSVSSWSTSAIYWDTQDVRLAADQLISIADLVTTEDGIANYNYDVIDAIRQAMVDYAAELLPLINAARGNTAEYTRLYQLYLQLMLDLDTMLSYDEGFKLERWTSLARNIADEVAGTTENDRNWLEWNARTQVTVWANQDCALHDYSNRCWAGLIKDFHYKRWEKFFTTNGGSFDGGWYRGFEYPWTVDFNNTYNLASDYSQVVIPNDMTATEKAVETFGKYFGRVKGIEKNYIFPMGVASNATKSMAIPEVYRGQEVKLPLIIGKEVTISSVWIDLNNDGNAGNGETLTANGNNVTIPADAAIGKTTAKVTYSDGTVITFNLALIEDIETARTVTAVAGANGSVAIEGTSELSITNTDAVKITAIANTGYNFENWTKGGEVVSNDNPFIYYGKEEATFTANFIQDKWGVPTEDKSDWGDAQVKTSFVNELTFAYYNREPETIYEASAAPDNLFNTIPQIINVPQGASFDVTWSDNGDNGLQFCCLSAYIDLNADGDFTDEGELLKVAGTKGAKNTAACEGKINVILPYDAPLGITHMRLRFDGAWKDNGYDAATKSYDAKAQLNRMCYEVVINVTEKSDKAATINVETNAADWGTVEVWTDETPTTETFKEYNVSANIPMYLRATKASEDVEFLGWYDQYGRLVTENPEHTMYAREDATYTARFRKFLEIDGWQIKYRTEPGKDVVTTKLANGVKPVAGKKYYIYAPTRPTNDGEYVNRYLYNNSGTLTLSTTESTAASYLWLCSIEDGKYVFQNVADPAKYLKHKGLADAPYGFELGTGTTYYEGLTMQSVPGDGETRNLFFVINDNGSGFNHSERAHNQSTEDYTTDFVFTEVTVPDVVILTSVRKSGNHDLVIPESVEILGEQCKIVGFDNNLFKDNKDLWSISLPATIEEMSNKKVFTGVVKGKGANASADASNYITTDLGTTLKPGEDWSISLTIEDNGNNFNQWGSALIATGNAPMNSTYGKGFQLYMQSTSNGGKLIVKLDNDNNNNALASISKGTKYRIDIVYTHANTQLVVTATSLESAAAIAASRAGAARASNSLTLTQDMSDFSVVSHAIPEGVNITNLEVTKGTVPDPFEGCTNLVDMTVDTKNANYYVDETTRTLKSTGGTTLHTLADKEKEEELRAIGELIDLAEALIAEVATSVDPTGKVAALTLSTTEGEQYYIYSNAEIKEGVIGDLLDNDNESYIHTTWEKNSTDGLHHYLRVYLGEEHSLNDFYFSYLTRNNNKNSERPKQITVAGSATIDGEYKTIAVLTDLPNTLAETYKSPIYNVNGYKYLRFMVDDTYRDLGHSGHKAYSMAEFDLYSVSSSAEVAPKYANLAGVTAGEVEGVYDAMAAALYYYNNGGTAGELTAAYKALKPLYDALNAKKDKVFNGVYHIVYNGAPVFVANDDNPALPSISWYKLAGYKLLDGTLDNTGEGDLEIQKNLIASKAVADALFTIVPNGDASGYTLSAQGLYLHSTPDQTNGEAWSPLALSNDENQAGVYLFVKSNNEYKLKCNISDVLNYVNDWGSVFGHNNETDTKATFTLTQVTEYTLTVPANGVTTLCLPFNVVLPQGVTAYNLPKANVVKGDGYSTYELVEVAAAGDVLAKNTPVIIKAVANDYTLTITMNDEGAKGSVENSVLRSGLVKTTVAAGNNYTFDGKNFNIVADDIEIAANQCWMELDESLGTTVIDKSEEPEFYGVYNIYFRGDPVFVAYAEANELNGLTGGNIAGFRLFDGAVAHEGAADGNTGVQKEFHERVIANRAVADALFTIVPNADATGYILSAQGQYMQTTAVHAKWSIQAFDADEKKAGVYLFETAESADIYKLRSNKEDGLQYVNDWGPVFGNNSASDTYARFSLTQVTEYTLTVPANGATTLCLPFNVVLPEGVIAYDLAKANITKGNYYSTYKLVTVATAGETLAKNTPVIIKAAANDYTLAITMDGEGAKASVENSVLRSGIVKSTLADGNNYTFDGENFKRVAAGTVIPANQCWMALNENLGDIIYGEAPVEPEVELVLPELGKVYRIKNYTMHAAAEYQYHYIANSNASIVFPTSVEDDDNSAMWVCTSADTENHKYKFVSALGTAAFGWQGAAEEALEYTISAGIIDGTVTLANGTTSLALTTEAWNNRGKAAFNQASDGGKVQSEDFWSTDWYLEPVENVDIAFNRDLAASHKWGTLYLPYAVEVPEGITAYYAKEVNTTDKVIELGEVDEVIPAYTPVLINRSEDGVTETFPFYYTTQAGTAVDGNLFVGRIMESVVECENNKKYYLLLNAGKGEAFYWVYKEYDADGKLYPGQDKTHIKCEANKAYLALDGTNPAALSFRYSGGTTDIEEVKGENGKVKTIYDLQGRKLTEITKPGIYIVDGKKVVVK